MKPRGVFSVRFSEPEISRIERAAAKLPNGKGPSSTGEFIRRAALACTHLWPEPAPKRNGAPARQKRRRTTRPRKEPRTTPASTRQRRIDAALAALRKSLVSR